MTARPIWVRKAYLLLVVGAGIALLAACYLYFQITAVIEPVVRQQPNDLDAKEAERKLKLYRQALQDSRRGFIRLSEVELNSYIQQQYFSETKIGETNAPNSKTHLSRSLVGLFSDEITWSYWLQQKVLGKPVHLFWQRAVELSGKPEHWTFQTKAMRVGKIEVPPRLWDFVQSRLGESDLIFSNRFDWLVRLPTLEVKTNDLTSSAELRLYTYPVNAVLTKTTR
jgi:hypothetical protein